MECHCDGGRMKQDQWKKFAIVRFIRKKVGSEDVARRNDKKHFFLNHLLSLSGRLKN